MRALISHWFCVLWEPFESVPLRTKFSDEMALLQIPRRWDLPYRKNKISLKIYKNVIQKWVSNSKIKKSCLKKYESFHVSEERKISAKFLCFELITFIVRL